MDEYRLRLLPRPYHPLRSKGHALLQTEKVTTGKHAIATHICNDEWVPGALALGSSLRNVHSESDLVLMIPTGVSEKYHELLMSTFDRIYREEPVTPHPSLTRDVADCDSLKLRNWELPYEKVLYMDADTIALQNLDGLLDGSGELSAKPDGHTWWNAGSFNSGMMVLEPSEDKAQHLQRALREKKESLPGEVGGDQDFLNYVFPPCSQSLQTRGHVVGCWKEKLGSDFNVFTRDLADTDMASIRQGNSTVKSVHFSGDWYSNKKPWMSGCKESSDSVTRNSQLHQAILDLWFDSYHKVRFRPDWKELLRIDCI